MSRILVCALVAATLAIAPTFVSSPAAAQTAEPAGSPRIVERPAPAPVAAPRPTRRSAARGAPAARAVVQTTAAQPHGARSQHTTPSGRRPR